MTLQVFSLSFCLCGTLPPSHTYAVRFRIIVFSITGLKRVWREDYTGVDGCLLGGKKIKREGNKRRGEKIILSVIFPASKWNFDLNTTFL